MTNVVVDVNTPNILLQRSKDPRMVYVVEIKHDREHLVKVMSRIREWLDGQRFEPSAFRWTTDEGTATFRLEFKVETEAAACAKTFGGEMSSAGGTFLA